MPNELKPCPFCGSDKVYIREGVMFAGAVHCRNCTADIIFHAVENALAANEDTPWEEKLTESYNRRVNNA